MLVCTVCLLVSIGMNDDWTLEPLNVNLMLGPSVQTLIAVGAKHTSLIVDKNKWFRLFTPMVLHAGIIHYFINMLALWSIGYAVEQSHGFIASAILFMIPAVGGTIISAIFLPEYISVGASGDGTTSMCHDCRFFSCLPFPFWAPYDQKWRYCDDCDFVTADAHKKNKDARNRQRRSGQGKHQTVRIAMVCRMDEASFGCVCDVVVVMGGGGDGVVLSRALCVCEID